MRRRSFLLGLAAAAAAGLSGCANAAGRTGEQVHRAGASVGNGAGGAGDAAVAIARSGPPPTLLDRLPGSGQNLAWTVDDGTDSAVVKAYVDFVRSADIRLTFFPNGRNPSWTEHAAQLRPLVESGQVQLGNHTWSHPDITRLSDRDVADEIARNDRFITETYGIPGRPYFRPPYGFHDARTDRIAADLGYTTVTLWNGSIGDSALLTSDQLMTLARQWFVAQHVVIGHANHPTVTGLYGQLLDLIRERRLRTVTLRDVFAMPTVR